ncbi:MAG: SusC/RagA family TonB-linked outer membrane protein [Firmicutes bacterium]|nr:SusC/RagA family TonB-linked outer membrane protein [Bacillota bacterium]MCM1400742.1 SusC/RagA family TonB-linked outer membrane protein [Bacteroides sp.]MCM1476839.1 SusC/RagA family TonB-linked outer membrane protein [Bacteroides sp.]
MRPKFVALCAAMACGPMLYAQSNQVLASTAVAAPQSADATTVSGEVLDPSGEPLIGVTVGIEGKGSVASTDFDGRFSVKARPGDVLTFSYIGYAPTSVKVTGAGPISVTMQEDSKTLDEVVVTALGIKREQKSLSYNVQQIKGDALTTNKDANFVNSLAGKVAGVNINASSSGTGGISKVVMRGTKSIMQSSNALYVVDGMPMRPARSNGDSGAFGSAGATEPIADLNPDDIESMSVLTGAAAAALYGSDAANGAIVITTKKGQAGKTKITVGSNLEWNRAWILPRFQNTYGAGQNGAYNPTSSYSWGARMTPYNNSGYDVGSDYLGTGFVATNSVTFSTGTEKNQTYASAAAVNSKGIVPNDRYDRYNFNIRNTTNFMDDKLTLDLNASYIYQSDRNMINQGSYMNPIVGAYLFPRGNDWDEVRMYEVYDPARKINVQNWKYGAYNLTVQNPYWVNYRNLRESYKDRYMMGGQLSYKVLPYLTLSGRVRIDNSYTTSDDKRYASTIGNLSDNSERGYFGTARYKEKQIYADFLASFNKDLGADFNLQANFGGSISDMRMESMDVRGGIADGSANYPGQTPGLTNFFTINNITTQPSKTQDGWREQTQSLYASADLGYRNTYYLTLTGRNDWPSALAGPNSKSSSFFYPSVGVSVLMTQMFADAGININPDILSFWKIRASWASVGTAFQRYIANPRYEWRNGTWTVLTQYPVNDLKPERTKSWEVGMNFRLFNDFTLDATWYQADTHNQTFNPGIATGKYSKIYIQTGNVRNWGMEFALNYDHTWGDFTWTTGLTYSFNKNKIVELGRNAVNPVTGEKLNIDQLVMSDTQVGATRFILREGGTMGDLYSMVDLARDANGRIFIDASGNVQSKSVAENPIKLGSVLPKGNLAWNNTFRYKNLSASAMFSARIGGIVYSRTQAVLDTYGVSEATGNARDLGYVLLNNGDRVNPEQWYSVIADGETVPQFYTYSATNVRLQEATISYLIPRRWIGNVCDIKVSLVGRNLWMIYNKAPYDPESVASAGNYFQGIDNFMMPSLRSFGFNVNFNF